jgi:hypothetical protein
MFADMSTSCPERIPRTENLLISTASNDSSAIRSNTEDEVARAPCLSIQDACAFPQAHLFPARLAFTRDSAHAAISLRIHADERVDNFTGVLPPDRRLGAEYLAWSAVHGLAVLFTDGPLRSLTPAQRSAVGKRVVDMVEKGL